MKRMRIIIAAYFVLLILANSVIAKQNNNLIEQRELPNQLGIYRHIQFRFDKNIDIYVVTFNHHYRCRIHRQTIHFQEHAETIKQLSEANFLVGINGGFYSEHFEPAGLFIEKQKTINQPSKDPLLNTCAYIQNEKLLLANSLEKCLGTYSAMQTGPAMINDGKIAEDLFYLLKQLPQLKSFFEAHQRSVVGLSNDNELFIMISSPATLNDIAFILKKYPTILGIKNIKIAIDLDGGPSTGLYIHFNKNPVYFAEKKKVKTVLLFN